MLANYHELLVDVAAGEPHSLAANLAGSGPFCLGDSCTFRVQLLDKYKNPCRQASSSSGNITVSSCSSSTRSCLLEQLPCTIISNSTAAADGLAICKAVLAPRDCNVAEAAAGAGASCGVGEAGDAGGPHFSFVAANQAANMAVKVSWGCHQAAVDIPVLPGKEREPVGTDSLCVKVDRES